MPTRRSGPAATIPKNYEGIVNLITREYPNLSTGFQQIARFLTQNPNVVALESINAVAAKCRTHPSSLVRFAQNLGYSGFKQLQSVFQTRLATAAPGFRERISALESELSRNKDLGSLGYLRDLVVRDMAALQDLLEVVSEKTLADTAKLLVRAETIYIAGQLRSEPIASLLRYLLTMLRRRVVLSPCRRAGARDGDNHDRTRRSDRDRLSTLCKGSRRHIRGGCNQRNSHHSHYGQPIVAPREGRPDAVHDTRGRISVLEVAGSTDVFGPVHCDGDGRPAAAGPELDAANSDGDRDSAPPDCCANSAAKTLFQAMILSDPIAGKVSC